MIDKITNLIYMTPEKWMHIRGIARRLKISPNSVRRGLAILGKKGVVETKREGNMIIFRANLENETYKRQKMVYNLHQIYESGIVDFLFDFYDHPQAIVLFGSYARGEDLSTSDVDIGIITSSRNRPDLGIYEKSISRKIELSLFNKKDISNEFFNNIINGVVLKGYLKR